MEIEAKFSVPDEATFQRLLEVDRLAEFGLGGTSVAELHDQYLDTVGLALLSRGYACRVRRHGDSYLATVKGVGGASGAVHRRRELEVTLPGPLSPGNWPPSQVRDLVLSLCDDQSLMALFAVEQTRHCRPVHFGDRPVAEFNLDRGQIVTASMPQSASAFLELEVELLAPGDERALDRIVAELEQSWGLAPQSQSKFERGLALADMRPALRREGASQ